MHEHFNNGCTYLSQNGAHSPTSLCRYEVNTHTSRSSDEKLGYTGTWRLATNTQFYSRAVRLGPRRAHAATVTDHPIHYYRLRQTGFPMRIPHQLHPTHLYFINSTAICD